MAFTMSPVWQPVLPKAPYQKYPLVMHRGEWPDIVSKQVADEEEEVAAVADGYTTLRPSIPEPDPEKPVLTLEQRVAVLEDLLLPIKEELFFLRGKKKR